MTFTRNICSGNISIEVESDERTYYRFTEFPIFQQMAQVIYFDRCMVKWAGMLLSEHNEQMKTKKAIAMGSLFFLAFLAEVCCAST